MNWLHFVGGFYTIKRFMREAMRLGVNRKVAPSIAKSMSYGDIVTLLRFNSGKVKAFAEFRIDRISFQSEIGDEIGQELVTKGKSEFVDSGGQVVRECGSYDIGGTWQVTAELGEIVEIAIQKAKDKGVKLDAFIGGPIVKVFEPLVELEDVVFFRGFKKSELALAGILVENEQQDTVMSVKDYKQRTKKRRKDIQSKLPGF